MNIVGGIIWGLGKNVFTGRLVKRCPCNEKVCFLFIAILLKRPKNGAEVQEKNNVKILLGEL